MEQYKPLSSGATVRVYFDHDTNGPILSLRVNQKIEEIARGGGLIIDIRYRVDTVGTTKTTHNVAMFYQS